MDTRIDWQEYFFRLAEAASARSSCPRLSVGCVLVKDNRVVSTGYNGSLPEEPHCIAVGCEMDDKNHCIRVVHAEENAVFDAARRGVSIEGAEAYVTYQPCKRCRRALTASGVTRIHFEKEYRPNE